MENLLIIENNLIQTYSLINNICKKIPTIRLYGIVSTCIKAIDIIKKEKVDIIILDLHLPDMNGINIINFISDNNIIKYNKSIIIFGCETDFLSETINNDYVFGYCSKINNVDFIINKINDLIEKKKNIYCNCIIDIRQQIKIELEKLNFNFSYLGTKYLVECIYECYYKNKIYDVNLNKEIYPIVSKRFNKSINSIRTNIFQSISIMYYDNDENNLSKYFGYKLLNKPKNKDLIIHILQMLK